MRGRDPRPVPPAGAAPGGGADLPAAGPVPPPPALRVRTGTLDNGLRILAARRTRLGRVNVLVWLPLARPGGDDVRHRLAAATLFGGARDADAVALAAELEALGAVVGAAASIHALTVSVAAPAGTWERAVTRVAGVLADPVPPDEEIGLQRNRLAQSLRIAAAQPTTVAADRLRARIHGRHPYGRGTPAPEAVEEVGPRAVRWWLRHEPLTDGGVVVVVGAVAPAEATRVVDRTLGRITSADRSRPRPLAPPPVRTPPGILVVHRPGAVQSNIRIGGPAPTRTDPAYPATTLANLVLGGYFSSRIVANLREDKGYTYSPRSSLNHLPLVSRWTLAADVGTDVTAPALAELRAETTRLATAGPTDTEVEAARRYQAGTILLGGHTQAGLAARLLRLASADLPLDHHRRLVREAARVGTDAVAAAAGAFVPRRTTTVVVGDADRIAGPLSLLDDVTVVT